MATASIPRTREVGPLAFRADVVPASFDAEKRTVKLTWTTGARVLRGMWDPYWEELSLDPKAVRMGRLQSGGAPLLNNHNSDSLDDVIGVVDSAQLDPAGRSGSAVVRFDRGLAGEDVMRKVGDGIIRNVSVGYRVYKMTKMEDGEGQIPVFRAVDWEPMELSMVPMGADAGAGTRSARMTPNTCELIEERNMPDPEPATTPIQSPAVPPAPVPAPVAPPSTEQGRAAPAPAAPTSDQVRAAERERVLGIQRRGRALGRPEAEIEEAVRAGIELIAFTVAAVDARAAAAPEAGGVIPFDKRDPRIEAGQDSREKWERGATAWIIERSGLGQLFADARTVAATPRYASAQWARAFDKIDLDPGEFRGTRMIDLARQSLERISMGSTRGVLPMELVGKAFTTRAATASTGDFPILLENALYKVLLAQYMVTPDTWTQFCKTGSVQDFRASKRYRMGTFGSLSALNELGEFVNKAIPDAERQSIIASTKGNIIGISRQAIINDDMGAFSSLATMLGRAAKLSVEVDVYAQLAQNAGLGPLMNDNLPLFDPAHKNITPGAALGSNAIDLDRVAMGLQRDPSNNEVLSLAPAILLLSIGLGGTARQINNGQYDFDAGLSSNKNPNTPNKVGGLFKSIVDSPRVAGTRRYLFADPGVAPTFEVAFLDGQQQPFMDIQQGWRVDGVEWKVREDYGVAPVDFRGAITNAGA